MSISITKLYKPTSQFIKREDITKPTEYQVVGVQLSTMKPSANVEPQEKLVLHFKGNAALVCNNPNLGSLIEAGYGDAEDLVGKTVTLAPDSYTNYQGDTFEFVGLSV